MSGFSVLSSLYQFEFIFEKKRIHKQRFLVNLQCFTDVLDWKDRTTDVETNSLYNNTFSQSLSLFDCPEERLRQCLSAKFNPAQVTLLQINSYNLINFKYPSNLSAPSEHTARVQFFFLLADVIQKTSV